MPADLPLKLPPGIIRGASDAEIPGRWYDGNLVRWVNGVLRPVPGWEKIVNTLVPESKIRRVHPWTDNDGLEYIGVVCETHVYVYYENDFHDITPVGGMVGPGTNPLEGGYGTHTYNLEDYGDPRPDVTDVNIAGPTYSASNWGEDFVFMTSYDGRLLRWKPSDAATPASAVTDAPINNRCFVITPQRHCVIFGLGGDFNRWGWCGQEDIEDWDFADPLGTAGDYYMSPAQRILSAIALKSGILWFTTKQAYFSSYLGVPYIYGYEVVGNNMSPIASGLLVEYSDQAVWIAQNGVWTFDGATPRPVASDLLDYFKDKSDPLYSKFRAAAVNIGSVTEIWFFFPTKGKQENDEYISWDYTTNVWSKGRLGRSCGVGPDFALFPIMSDGNSLYYHERGLYYGGASLPWVESAAINMKSGSKLSTVLQAQPDHGAVFNNVWYTLFGRIPRLEGASPAPESQRRQTRPDGYLDFRLTARDFRLRIEAANDGGPTWTFGQMLIKISQRGGR